MTPEERMKRFVELSRLGKGDEAVRSIMERWCEATGCTLSEMAQNEPEEFDFMVEAIDDFLEQAPQEKVEWWAR